VVFLLEIDGSYGEGGGQILRTAISLSTLTKKPVKIINIRANRPNPGIKAQHYISIHSLKKLCNAETQGLEIGSSTLVYKPGEFKAKNHKFDIGTAGSITLAFQAIILASLKTDKPIKIKLRGGTDVKWSLSWDYFKHVFLSLLKKTGLTIDTKLINRGYYPKGGGEAEITINPCNKIMPINLDSPQEYTKIKGIINISNLPDHISSRTKHSVIKNLLQNNYKTSIEVEQSQSLSPGIGITIWTDNNNAILGSTMLGERGVPSEEIGRRVTMNLFKEIKSKSTMDVYCFDQILPYMALAKENGPSSCIVREISSHAKTNMWIIKQFFNVDFHSVREENHFRIRVR
jgi:RNA 3'-phosphate cyclase